MKTRYDEYIPSLPDEGEEQRYREESNLQTQESNRNIYEDVKRYGVPAGSIMPFSGEIVPEWWLECDGSSLLKADYPELFAAIGTIYGSVDANHFNIPDCRGYFLRGYDNSAGNDPDAASRTDRGDGQTGDKIGTKQTDAGQGHYHEVWKPTTIGGALPTLQTAGTYDTDFQQTGAEARALITDGVNGTPRTSSETRALNISVIYLIKY